MNILVFEDEYASRLHPISLARPTYAITCGSYRLVDWLRELQCPLFGVVRPYLAEIQRIDFPDLARPLPPGPTLLVNARVVPSVDVFQQLKKIVDTRATGVVQAGGDIAAMAVAQDTWSKLATNVLSADHESWPLDLSSLVKNSSATELPALETQLPMFEYPHDVIRWNMQILSSNLQFRISKSDLREVSSGVFVATGVTINDFVVTDTKAGPIVLDENSSVGPFCFMRGPAYLGRSAKLIEHSAIKDGVSAGHTTKIGGEVEAAVIEPYTNKQHHGFLGHSYLGSWINLGAGTCNSDLKNTYGKVNLEYHGEKMNTGMQFVGCMIGDYSKTAINTGIFTGKIIGVCSMLYGFVTTNVPSFVNYARLFGQVTELPPQVMIATQQRMFQRRNVVQRPCDMQLVHDMYDLTRSERQLTGEPLSL